jgi:DNA mismatch endonuclease, patch repair protein
VNVDYWAEKVAHNQARDQETNRLLEERGWTVLRFWEHEPSTGIADAIERVVRGSPALGGNRVHC